MGIMNVLVYLKRVVYFIFGVLFLYFGSLVAYEFFFGEYYKEIVGSTMSALSLILAVAELIVGLILIFSGLQNKIVKDSVGGTIARNIFKIFVWVSIVIVVIYFVSYIGEYTLSGFPEDII